MKRILVIGSVVADVVLQLERLPKTGDDIHIERQNMALGGCAYNVYSILRLFQIPALLFSPIGTGIYGDFVRTSLAKRGISLPPLEVDGPNGCCYCLVERSGERSFLCEHGAEYRYRREWFDQLEGEEYSAVYVCGLELEEESGVHILEYLERNPQLPVYFAPGPRAGKIGEPRVKRLLALHPVLHLNENEALALVESLLGKGEVHHIEGAARRLYELTGNSVIVTLGKRGAMFCEGGKVAYLSSRPAVVADTIGAGDAHIGTVMACCELGLPLAASVNKANEVAAACVEIQGSELPEERFPALDLEDIGREEKRNAAGFSAE